MKQRDNELDTLKFNHKTVLLKETVSSLNVKKGGIYIDCTTGGAGHSLEIARLGGRLICFDMDINAIKTAKEKLSQYDAEFYNKNFAEMADCLNFEVNRIGVDGVLMDLGVSSPQLDVRERGFSFHEDAPLDMRMDPYGNPLSAYNVVNEYPLERLIKILFEYGEERYARGIAQGIVLKRQSAPIETTLELAEVIKQNVPLSVRNAKNPSRKTFQAIRIEVNNELESLSKGLDAAFNALKSGGRLAAITFHSLEDRIVKRRFGELTTGCICPKTLPICVCNNSPKAKAITRKPITPSENELYENRRSRSAKLRVIEKV